jgi:D-alanyl-D-alanine carboxypeptidase/D-alanyl-D-alanine-endopeptidase (penicillin-binding protein 4)
MKIVTLAAAAAYLGWDYAYETRLLAGGPIEAGALNGDLLVVGSGDPAIDDWDGRAAALFRTWAERLEALGVRTIGGRIVGDDAAFDDEPLGAGWAWDDLSASYATGVGALQFNQNTVRLTMAAGSAVGDPVTVSLSPSTGVLTVRNLLATAAAGTPAVVTTRRLPGSTTLEVRGSLPSGGPPVFRNVSVDNTTLYLMTALREALAENGIDVRGTAAEADAIPDAPSRDQAIALLTYRSPPLSDLAATMMKNSQNLYAETLLKTMGIGEGPGTSEAGCRIVSRILQEWGVPPGAVLVADGSGLSRYNLVTAEALVTVLARVHHDDRLREPFVAALPVAGRDGTLAGRLADTPAQDNVRAKTGSLSNARTLAGYVTTADGEPLAFAILANNFGSAAATVDTVTDALVVRLAEFSRR